MRSSIFPIENQFVWNYYQDGLNQRWVASKIDLSKDKYELLNTEEQSMIDNVLAFFSSADNLINDNVAFNLYNKFPILELSYWYGLQIMQEQIHAELYSLFIDTYIKDHNKKYDMFNALQTNSVVANKSKWFQKWVQNGTLAQQVIGLALCEGLMFSSLFATVFYFRDDNRLKGFIEGNDYIMKEENSHYEMSIYVYHNYVEEKMSKEDIKAMILECYEVEKEYILNTISDSLIGLNKNLMLQYVQFITDTIATALNIDKIFNVTQPLSYMNQMAITQKNNFFEVKTNEYTRTNGNIDDFTEDF